MPGMWLTVFPEEANHARQSNPTCAGKGARDLRGLPALHLVNRNRQTFLIKLLNNALTNDFSHFELRSLPSVRKTLPSFRTWECQVRSSPVLLQT